MSRFWGVRRNLLLYLHSGHLDTFPIENVFKKSVDTGQHNTGRCSGKPGAGFIHLTGKIPEKPPKIPGELLKKNFLKAGISPEIGPEPVSASSHPPHPSNLQAGTMKKGLNTNNHQNNGVASKPESLEYVGRIYHRWWKKWWWPTPGPGIKHRHRVKNYPIFWHLSPLDINIF